MQITLMEELYENKNSQSYCDNTDIIVIILFQDDIRRALTNVGKTPFFNLVTAQADSEKIIEELVKACVTLSRKRIGALIVIENGKGLKDFIEVGIHIDSKVNAELLVSIFTTASPIHDGAVIVSEGKMNAAGCFLPLTRNPNVEKSPSQTYHGG